MHPSELFDEIQRQYKLTSDVALSALLGLSPARVSQMRARPGALTKRQIVSYFKQAESQGRKQAFSNPIRAIVEMYALEAVVSQKGAKWEMLPTGVDWPRNKLIRECLESAQGVYFFYDSMRCAIYTGKTERLGLWKEMTNAFNRARSNHQSFFVAHPTTGATFSPAWEHPRQPRKGQVFLHDTAQYFSAYEVVGELIPSVEALVIRAFCNSLSNKRMERFFRAKEF